MFLLLLCVFLLRRLFSSPVNGEVHAGPILSQKPRPVRTLGQPVYLLQRLVGFSLISVPPRVPEPQEGRGCIFSAFSERTAPSTVGAQQRLQNDHGVGLDTGLTLRGAFADAFSHPPFPPGLGREQGVGGPCSLRRAGAVLTSSQMA